MIVIDEALRRLEAEGRPVRVGIVGAGFMARGVVRQLWQALPGLRVVAIANRTPAKAHDALRRAGHEIVRDADEPEQLDRIVAQGGTAVTHDPDVLCVASEIDVLVEATGAVDFGAHVLTSAIANGKDVVSMNAELDATVGPILQLRAQEAGVLVTGADGDQPAVQANLARFVRGLGLTPLVHGNIKGLQDRYRTPATQAGYAAQWGQTPQMVTSFADGTKISMEQALVANALDLTIATRAMLGPHHSGHVDDLRDYFLNEVGIERLRELGGIVDYVVGAVPSPGVFVLAANDDPEIEVYLRYGKLGDGPLYSFYVPYHLTALEVPASIARVALFRDHVVSSRPVAPRVDVVACAKRDLKAGEVLDGLGGFSTYGLCERAELAAQDGLVPIGITEGARVRRAVARDEPLRRDDLELPDGRLVNQLRREQDERLGPHRR